MDSFFTDGKLVKALRKRTGIEKPYALPWGEWKQWEEKTKAEQPWAYFLTESVPKAVDRVISAIVSPYYDVKYYVRNRFIRRSHVLRTDCKPGQYMDTDEKIITGLVNAVIDYVEIELALKSRWSGTEESKSAVWKNGRCPQLGLEYLNWEITLLQDETMGVDPGSADYLAPSSQATAAKEVKAIYEWAKNRNLRPNPLEASGWSAYCDKYKRNTGLDSIFNREDWSEEQHTDHKSALTQINELEKAYLQEDEDMLIRLIRVRSSLWT